MLGAVLERRYLLVQRIARRGMATVYRGLVQRLDRLVAVKVLDLGRITAGSDLPALPPEIAAKIAAGFQHEAKMIARLNHPNVVAVFDHGVHTDCRTSSWSTYQGTPWGRRSPNGTGWTP